eukprot:5795663-Pleurochrysis_carterae.AAC.1
MLHSNPSLAQLLCSRTTNTYTGRLEGSEKMESRPSIAAGCASAVQAVEPIVVGAAVPHAHFAVLYVDKQFHRRRSRAGIRLRAE